MDSLGFPIYKIMLSVNRGSFPFFLSYPDAFYFFFLPNSTGQNLQDNVAQTWWELDVCLLFWILQESFQSSPWSMMLAVGFSQMPCIRIRKIPFISSLSSVSIMKSYQILSILFSLSVEIPMWSLSFILVRVCYINRLLYTEPTLHSWNKCYLVML